MRGRVAFSGSVPSAFEIPVLKNIPVCGTVVEDTALVVDPGSRGVKNTVIYLEAVEGGKPFGPGPVVDSINCLFEPRIQVVRKGAPVLLRNSDPVLHNPHTFTEDGRTLFNVALTQQGQSVEKVVKVGGPIRVQCDAHLHMNGWFIALEHPYAAVSAADGSYEITEIPPGRYRLVAWHEGFTIVNRSEVEASSTQRKEDATRPAYEAPRVEFREVEVLPGATLTQNFELRARP